MVDKEAESLIRMGEYIVNSMICTEVISHTKVSTKRNDENDATSAKNNRVRFNIGIALIECDWKKNRKGGVEYSRR